MSIRADGATANLTVKNTVIDATTPIIVRKLNATTQTYKVAIVRIYIKPICTCDFFISCWSYVICIIVSIGKYYVIYT